MIEAATKQHSVGDQHVNAVLMRVSELNQFSIRALHAAIDGAAIIVTACSPTMQSHYL